MIDVEGETSPGFISTGDTIKFHFGVYNNTGDTVKGLTNGFRVYSPDGAQWNTTRGRVHPDFRDYFGYIHNAYSHEVDGTGSDTVGFAFAILDEGGIPDGFEDSAWTVRIGPIDALYSGKEICIDSCYWPPSGTWLWSPGSVTPTWDGPHCWEIGALIDVSGYLYYTDSTPSAIATGNTIKPLDNVLLSLCDADASSSEYLDIGWTNWNGYFSFSGISNIDENGTNGQDLYVEVLAFSPDVDVKKRVGSATIKWFSDTTNDVASGSVSLRDTCPFSSSGAFYVLNTLEKGLDKINGLGYADPTHCLAVLVDSTVTCYDSDLGAIIINDSVDNARGWPDTWDESKILHELGHHVEWENDFCDSTTGQSHSVYTIISPEFAGCDGFAHFFSALTLDDSFRVSYWDDFTDSSWHDLETGLYGSTSQIHGSVNCLGGSNEGAVAGILWDIYDQSHDNYSGLGDWGSTTLPHNPDNVWDSLWDGPDNILEALMVREVTSPASTPKRHPDNIHEFYSAWYQQPILGNCREIYNIFYEHGDTSVLPPKKGECSCCENMGDINHSGNPVPNITDLIYLVSYMFQDSWYPPCMDETDVDGNGSGPDIADLTYLVTYMFQEGPELVPCD